MKNNIRSVAVTMDLLCKDAGEMVHHQGNVASFVIRTDLDKSLLDSSRNAQRFDFIAVPPIEMLSGESWTLSEHYLDSHSQWHGH